jgi:Na+/H+ antiporter NhaD/arsenite permease-like protein
MFKNIFEPKHLLLILTLFFGLFIVINALKKFGVEGMTGGDGSSVTGTGLNLTTTYNF